MLALARVMMSKPRLLMIDELAFGLAPMTVERLMDIVRRVNAEGATVILVEQSVNRAMTLAEHAFFLERGEVRFDGSITELLSRDDLLRPVFLASVGAALGQRRHRTPNGAASPNGAVRAAPPGCGGDDCHTPPRLRPKGTEPDTPHADGLWLAGPGPDGAGRDGPADRQKGRGTDVIAVSFPSSVILEGAILGLNYGLLATGLVLIYRTNRVINFAQGQLGVVAAVFLVKLYYDYGINYWAALVAAVALAAAVGALSELVLRRLFNRPRVMVMVATIGLSQVLFLFTLFPFIRPKKLFRAFPVPVDWSFHIGTFLFPPGEVVTLIVAPIVALGLAAFIRFSPWGLAMRASAENSESARLSGVWVRRTSTVAWTLAGALSAFTAILASPSQTSTLTEVLSPGLLLLALLAALIGGMVSLPVAFVAGIGDRRRPGPPAVEHHQPVVGVGHGRARPLRVAAAGPARSGRVAAEGLAHRRADVVDDGDPRLPTHGRRTAKTGGDDRRARRPWSVAALLPLVLDVGRSFLMSQICIYGVIALSLTVLTGWAGQVSLGQFALVAVGADMAAHLGGGIPLILLLPFAGVVTGLVSVLVGLTALRIRGLYLAVSTLGFALFMQTAVLATSCWTVPLIHKTHLLGAPRPPVHVDLAAHTVRTGPDVGARLRLVLARPCSSSPSSWCGCGVTGASPAGSSRCATTRWQRARPASPSSAPSSWPSPCRGSWPATPGCASPSPPNGSAPTPSTPPCRSWWSRWSSSAGSTPSPVPCSAPSTWWACPPSSGPSTTIEFLTSGFGLMAFILYLPGGMAEVMHRFGDLVTAGVVHLRARWRGERTARVTGTHRLDRPRHREADRDRCGGRGDLVTDNTPNPTDPDTDSTLTDSTLTDSTLTDSTLTDSPILTDEDERRGPLAREPEREGPARLDITDLVVSFGGLRALDKVTRVGRAGHHRRAHRAQRVGQDDAARHGVGPRGARRGAAARSTARTSPTTSPRSGPRSASSVRSRTAASTPSSPCRTRSCCARTPASACSVLSTTLQLPWARRTERDKRKAVDRAIASFGLERFRHHLTGHLSTGTRRVVDLASIVLAGPRLLLLDEPTAGIAQREAEAFIPLLRQLQEVTGSTILLVEHDVPLVFELCSTVIVMQTGSVVISGPPDVVREDPRALAAYLGASDAALNVTGPARRDPGGGVDSGADSGWPAWTEAESGVDERAGGPVGAVAAQRDPVGDAQGVAVVVEGVVQRGPVVPEGHRPRLPVVAAAELGPLAVAVEHVEQRSRSRPWTPPRGTA